MMLCKLLPSVLALSLLTPAAALAQDKGMFGGFDLSTGWASGSSNTTDGGAAFAGGGVVDKVKFKGTSGVGAHLGYRWSSPLSTYVSYHYSRGDVSWRADFPLIGVGSAFEGRAASHAIMANIAYDFALSEKTTLRAAAGAGISINDLSDVVETDGLSGLFLSDVASRSRNSAAAQLEAGVRRQLTPRLALSVNAGVGYHGGGETGDTRSGNLGITDITPYRIDDVWRTKLGATVNVAF